MVGVYMQVESLTAARNASQAGTEPSDAIRVVNSVLTQLDQIKRLESCGWVSGWEREKDRRRA